MLLYSLSSPQLTNFLSYRSPAKIHMSLSQPLQHTPHESSASLPHAFVPAVPAPRTTPQFAPPITSIPPFKVEVGFSFSCETLPGHSNHQPFLILLNSYPAQSCPHHHKFLVVFCHVLLCNGFLWIGIEPSARLSQR